MKNRLTPPTPSLSYDIIYGSSLTQVQLSWNFTSTFRTQVRPHQFSFKVLFEWMGSQIWFEGWVISPFFTFWNVSLTACLCAVCLCVVLGLCECCVCARPPNTSATLSGCLWSYLMRRPESASSTAGPQPQVLTMWMMNRLVLEFVCFVLELSAVVRSLNKETAVTLVVKWWQTDSGAHHCHHCYHCRHCQRCHHCHHGAVPLSLSPLSPLSVSPLVGCRCQPKCCFV
jgi:hypothetical protein